MQQVVLNLSEVIIPLFLFFITAYGLFHGQKIYEQFIRGAVRGVKIVVDILPTLIGLFVAVGVLRASGFLDWMAALFSTILEPLHVPSELVPLTFVRLFSASAATGIVIDLFKAYGTDSTIGLIASIMMSSTETVFYTMSVYYMSVGIRKTRWTLAGGLLCVLVGVVASIFIVSVWI